MKSKLDFIERLDMFGKRIGLYYDGKQKKNSLIGIIFTFMYIIIFLVLLIYKLVKIFRKTELIIYDTYIYSGQPPSIQLNHDIFYGGFALEDPLTYDAFIDERIYFPKAYYKKAVRIGSKWNWFVKELELEICKLEKFGKSYRDIFKHKPLDNFYCFKEMNESLIGHFIYDNYSFFFISFFPCINSTENNNHCRPEKEIDYYLNRTFVTFHMQDVEINPQQYNSPIIHRDKDVYTAVGKKLFKEIHAFFQIVKIETDLDVFGLDYLKYMRKNEFLKYDSLSVMDNLIENDIYVTGESFCDVTLKLSDKIWIQKRTFIKLSEILGNIGGFMQVVFLFLKIISYFSIQILYETSLVNNLFEFNIEKKIIYFNSKQRKYIKKNSTFYPKLYIPIRCYQKASDKSVVNDEEKINSTKLQLNVGERKIQTFLNHNSKINSIELNVKPHFSLNYKDFTKKKNLNNNKIIDESNDKIRKDDKSDINIFNINMNYNEGKIEHKGTKRKRNILVKRIKINGLCLYFCFFYVRKRKNLQNILLDEGIRIIVEQLDLLNILKKLYKEDKAKERMRDNDIIIMSDDCKNKLKKYCKSLHNI